MRYGNLARPAERATLYWGQKECKKTRAQLAAQLVESDLFKEIFGSKLAAIDSRNRTIANKKNMGRPCRWSALQLESVFVYRRVSASETLKGAWTELHADAEARLLLGLGEQIPSRATLSRYVRQHFDEEERCEKYMELDRRLKKRVLESPEFDQETRILGMDGSKHGTHFTPPIPNPRKNQKREEAEGKKPRKIVNDHIPAGTPGAITAPSAGFIGGHNAKSGQGWQWVTLWSERGTLLNWDISPLNENECPAAERVLESYRREVLEHRGAETLSVLTADAGFDSRKIRKQAQEMRLVPNIHKASHKKIPGKKESKTKNAKTRNEKWYRFKYPSKPHYENWMANGHAEIKCSCGQGKLKSVREPNKSGGVTLATKGNCPNCGHITITSGCWKTTGTSRTDEKRYYRRCLREDEADWTLGNSLTFNSKLSKAYGQDRFGWGESFHATVRRRFGLLKDKSWMRDITEVKTEFAIASCAISLLLLERQAAQQTADSPPSQPSEDLPLAA